MRRGARFDETGRYRYSLWRTWDPARPRIAFVMLNPSTADHRVDDPTIRRCIGFAQAWGFGSLTVVNLFAYRTPSPQALRCARAPVGPENDLYLARARRSAAATVVAWGVHGSLLGRDLQVLALLGRQRRQPLLCLGVTAQGHPRHPLYLAKHTALVPFSGKTLPAHAGTALGSC